MKPGKVIWASAAVVLCILMVGIIGCKGKKADVERSADTSSEDYSFDKGESLDESDVISENYETEGNTDQTDEEWHEEDEQEPNDELEYPDEEPNVPEEEPNDEPNVPHEEPNESPEEPNDQWL